MSDESRLPALVSAYLAAWNESDDAQRARILADIWDDDGVYTDPTAFVTGRAALVAHIGRFRAHAPNARFELASAIEGHHDALRFDWRMLGVGPDPLPGTDFGLVGPDGRLARITGFFSR